MLSTISTSYKSILVCLYCVYCCTCSVVRRPVWMITFARIYKILVLFWTPSLAVHPAWKNRRERKCILCYIHFAALQWICSCWTSTHNLSKLNLATEMAFYEATNPDRLWFHCHPVDQRGLEDPDIPCLLSPLADLDFPLSHYCHQFHSCLEFQDRLAHPYALKFVQWNTFHQILVCKCFILHPLALVCFWLLNTSDKMIK